MRPSAQNLPVGAKHARGTGEHPSSFYDRDALPAAMKHHDRSLLLLH